MNVLFTVFVVVVAGGWLFVVLRRLASLREQVKLAWQRLEADQANEAIRHVYNKQVAIYNDALNASPANIVAAAAGFKPAKPF